MELYVSNDKHRAAIQIAAKINAKIVTLNGQGLEKLDDGYCVVVPASMEHFEDTNKNYKLAKNLVQTAGKGAISIERHEIQKLNWKGHEPIFFNIEAETVNINIQNQPVEQEYVLDQEEKIEEIVVQEAFICTTYDHGKRLAGYGFCYKLPNGELRVFSGGARCNRRQAMVIGFKKLMEELVGLKLINNGYMIYTDISSLSKIWSGQEKEFAIEELKKRYGSLVRLNIPDKTHEWYDKALTKAITIIGHTNDSYTEILAQDKMQNRFSGESRINTETSEIENEEIQAKLDQLLPRQQIQIIDLEKKFKKNGGLTRKQYSMLMNWK